MSERGYHLVDIDACRFAPECDALWLFGAGYERRVFLQTGSPYHGLLARSRELGPFRQKWSLLDNDWAKWRILRIGVQNITL